MSTQPDPIQPQPAQSGLSDNAAGALAYVTIIPAIIFLIVEPYNKNSYIRFHSWQSIFLGIAWFRDRHFINGHSHSSGGSSSCLARWPFFVAMDHCPAQGVEGRALQAAVHRRSC